MISITVKDFAKFGDAGCMYGFLSLSFLAASIPSGVYANCFPSTVGIISPLLCKYNV